MESPLHTQNEIEDDWNEMKSNNGETANSRCPASAGYLKFFEAGWRRAYQKRECDSFSAVFDWLKCWERCQRCKSLQDNTEN